MMLSTRSDVSKVRVFDDPERLLLEAQIRIAAASDGRPACQLCTPISVLQRSDPKCCHLATNRYLGGIGFSCQCFWTRQANFQRTLPFGKIDHYVLTHRRLRPEEG